jgi:hypothetical protein
LKAPTQIKGLLMSKASSKKAEAQADVFLTAFNSLNSETRRLVLVGMLDDEQIRDDVESALLWEDRKTDKRKPFRKYLEEHKSRNI